MYLLDLKDDLAEVKSHVAWAFSLERCNQDTCFTSDEVRSGELWIRELETRPATPELTNDFPGAAQFIRCIRTVLRKDTGEIRFQETEYGLGIHLLPPPCCTLTGRVMGRSRIVATASVTPSGVKMPVALARAHRRSRLYVTSC